MEQKRRPAKAENLRSRAGPHRGNHNSQGNDQDVFRCDNDARRWQPMLVDLEQVSPEGHNQHVNRNHRGRRGWPQQVHTNRSNQPANRRGIGNHNRQSNVQNVIHHNNAGRQQQMLVDFEQVSPEDGVVYNQHVNRNHRGGRGGPQQFHTNRPNQLENKRGNKMNQHRSQQQNDGNDSNLTEQRDRFFRLGFKRLEELTGEDSDTLVLKLSNGKTGFANLLEEKLSDDYVVLIIKVIAKMCQSEFDSNKASIMSMACKENFLNHLKNFILALPIKDDKSRSRYYWNDVKDFWNNTHTFCETIINTIPSVACDILQKLLPVIFYTIPNLDDLPIEVAKQFEKVQCKLDIYKEETEQRKKTSVAGKNKADDLEPSDDFRDMSLYPTSKEIIGVEKGFCRENIVEGAYKNVNHFLDVQFRLLREDFVSPLRKGVCQFLQSSGGAHKKLQNIKVHRKVQFLRPELVNGIRGILLQFYWGKEKLKFKYENSRKFMFGSLVCFTNNNFGTVLFGKVIDRKPELLGKGLLVVGFDPGTTNFEFHVDYIMIEYNVYFESYYHVLNALKSINEENLPMKEYLVYVTPCVQLPEYYKESCELVMRGYRANVKAGIWPTAKVLRLNEAQYVAFMCALTQKFAIVQGPPGTGKTYLGLQIAKTLIENHKIWYKWCPMLVVCYTNHALDQFLEGLVGTTDKIVRIGGQSKNEKLIRFNIKEIRSKENRRDVNQLLWEKRMQVEGKVRDLKAVHANMDAVSNYDGVINFSHFVQLEAGLNGSWFDSADGKSIKNWLLGGRTSEERAQEQMQLAVERVSRALLDEENVMEDLSDESDTDEIFDGFNRAENRIDIDDILNISVTYSVSYVLKVTDLEREINEIKNLAAVKEEDMSLDKQRQLEDLEHFENDLDYLKMRLSQGKDATRYHYRPRNVDLRAPQTMHAQDRWHLYFYWLHLYKNVLSDRLEILEREYNKLYKEYEEVRSIEDTQIMKRRLVIGMTTTSAARLQTTLQSLRCPIVIVEEAAEILESHIVVSLTNHCQHLILIGDHQQLRPSTADFTIQKKFRLGISLFERMVKNKVHCNLLNVQHRMRPEIASLIVPAIYPNLENHQSVYKFPSVKGVDNCLYFITHRHEEEINGDTSRSNPHEAKFLLQLAKYLILNGYEPEDITILAAYSGQMFTLWRERKRMELLKDVRITINDNYQGEESKIILLSLVRNNSENSIGFLSIENRVCVALSRAREGFYIMGNIDLLCSKSTIWSKVRGVLETQGAIGTSLPLRCEIHRDTITKVETADDFFKVSEGGCSRLCGQILNCGHECVIQCHIQNRDHKEYKCMKKCTRSICDRNHPCPKMCWQECGACNFPMPTLLRCGHIQNVPCFENPEDYLCQVKVLTELPCKHEAKKPCFRETDTFPCPYPCDTRIDKCGHACTLKCHFKNDPDHIEYKCRKPCAKYRAGCTVRIEEHLCTLTCSDDCSLCSIPVKKSRTVCAHVHTVDCHVNVDDLECERRCKKTLPCGHPCKLKCNEPCGKCIVLVNKVLPDCNHTVRAKCSGDPNRAMCTGKCPRLLACGHPCLELCKDVCTVKCKALIVNPFVPDCGHIFKIPCHLKTEHLKGNSNILLQYCREPCASVLECKHSCSGTCGECHQGRIHKSCAEKCGSILVCGHECTIPCRQMCQPCKLPCTYKCQHSKCKKKCGEPCTPCTETCPRRCTHVQCKAKCGEKCTVEPCTQPCNKHLKCGHKCIGYCGDPCPPLCLTCDKAELTEVFLGKEDEEGARFVLLEECGHVIESQGLELWLQSDGDQINVKRCPKCKTQLSSTKRYSDYIKESVENVMNVKRKFYGTERENEDMRVELLRKLKDILASTKLKKVSSKCAAFDEKLRKKLQPIRLNKRQKLDNLLAKTFTSKIEIYQQICELYDKSKVTARSSGCVEYINFLLETLAVQEDRVTNQEINDYERELMRLRRMLQLSEIEERTHVVFNTSNPRIKELYKTLVHKLYSVNVYRVEEDTKIKESLIELSKKTFSGLDVTDEELKQIVKAVGVTTGAWYKCRNGHPYAIGDCGGAMEQSNCIECRAPVGGSNHALVRGNTHAANIDNSRHSAWSEAANMANYGFGQL